VEGEEMGKAPAFMFYVRDWLSDPELRMASHGTKGIWIDMLCFMWEASVRGELIGTEEQLKKLVGANERDMSVFMTEAKSLNFADVTECNEIVTIRNRRMYAEYKERQNTRLRVQRYREKNKRNSELTPSSSYSYSNPPISPLKGGVMVKKTSTEKIPIDEAVKEVLTLLNETRAEITGKPSNRTADKEIRARLKQGYTVHELCRIVLFKAEDEHFRQNGAKYLVPSTLFRPCHIQEYLDGANEWNPTRS